MAHPKKEEKKFPSVINSFEIALKSYDWAVQRSDAVDDGIDKLMAWTLSVTVGVVSITSTKINGVQLRFDSYWFYAAMILLAIIVLLGIWTKVRKKNSLILINPEIVYKKWTKENEWGFKKYALYWAGKHFIINQTMINKKGYVAGTMWFIFLIEILCLAMWIIHLTQ